MSNNMTKFNINIAKILKEIEEKQKKTKTADDIIEYAYPVELTNGQCHVFSCPLIYHAQFV